MIKAYVKINEPQLESAAIIKIQNLKAQGLSLREISRQVGISHKTVHRYTDNKYREKVCSQDRIKRQERAQKVFNTMVEHRKKNLTDYERGYLEAIIDGEGYLGLLPSKRNGKSNWNIKLSIGNTCKELVENVRSTVGTGSICYNKVNGRHSESWTYTAGPTILRWLLPQLKLINKEVHRQLILEALELTHGNTGIGHYGDNNDRLAEIDTILKSHNKKERKGWRL